PAPDHEQRPHVLEAPLRKHLALLAQVARQEDDQEDLRELAGLHLDRADAHPQTRAVHRRADAREARQEEQCDGADPEQVLVVLEDPVVAAEAEEREREQPDSDHDPEALLELVVRAEPVDLGDADRGQERRHGQEVWIGIRHDDPRHHVSGEVQREEEERIPERSPRDEGLARDVDGGEAQPRQHADCGEVQELAVARPETGQRASPHQTSTTMTAISAAITSSASSRLPRPACGVSGSAGAASDARSSSAETIIVSSAGGAPVGGGATPSSGCSVSSSSGDAETAVAYSRVFSSGSPGRGSGASGASTISNSTAVMLSSPPPRFAAFTSARAAASRSARLRRSTSAISLPPTMSDKPSEQRR